MGLSEITPGKAQEYRVHRIATSTTGKAPARSTIHDEIVTLRQVLRAFPEKAESGIPIAARI